MGEKFDPLEAAKIVSKKAPKEPPALPVKAVAAPVPAKAAPAPEQPKTEPASVPSVDVAPVSVAAAPKPVRFKVVEDKQVSINGCLTHVIAGQVIDPLHYGEKGMKSLAMQGVKLVEV